jgi:hypothetical protein
MAKKPSQTDVAAPVMAGAAGEIVKVRGPEDGRWRGGLQFGPIELEIDLSTITAADFEEIEADSYLTVRRLEPPAA